MRPETMKALDRYFDGVDEQIAALEKRIDELRAESMRYRGAHQRAVQYKRGDCVSHDGVLWFCCTDDTGDRPGKGDGWQLMMKSNSNGGR